VRPGQRTRHGDGRDRRDLLAARDRRRQDARVPLVDRARDHQRARRARAFDEQQKDARDWVALGDAPSDEAVEAYLLQHGYQDWEVEPFKSEVAPVLAKFAADEPTYEAWAAERASEYIASLSFEDFYVSDDLKDTLLDVLFLVIGVAAAFNLVMQKSREEVAGLQRREERSRKREAVAAATEGEDGEPA
jgi:hypothetical protein